MFWNNTVFKQSYYNFIFNLFGYKKVIKTLPIDFQKPWWKILTAQKKMLIIVLIAQSISSIFDSLFPVFLGLTFNTANIPLFGFLVGVKLFLILVWHVVVKYYNMCQIQTMASVEFSANKFFLTVDPIFHTTRSSGQIIAKIQRGSSSYESVLDIVGWDLLSFILNLVTVIGAMFFFSWQLGLTSLVFISIMFSFNILATIIKVNTFEPRTIIADDKVKAIDVEILQQANFIRAVFATTEQIAKSKKAIFKRIVTEANQWQSSSYVSKITESIYLASLFCIGLIVLLQIQNKSLNAIIGVTIILTYINSTNHVLNIGNKITRLTRNLAAITDLYTFIRGFGKQTFPVLEGDQIKLLD